MQHDRWWYLLRMRWLSVFRQSKLERELDKELQFHLEQQAEEYRASGMTESEARRSAIRKLGGLDQIRESCRDMRRTNSLETTFQDVRYAVRSFGQHPGFVLMVVSTLALAIGANIAVFSVVNAVLLRALPFSSPEQLVWITSVRPDNPDAPFSLPEFIDYRAQTRAVSGLAAYANWSANVSGTAMTERLQGARMSANAFDVLGVSPAAGRLLQDSDDRPDAPRVAVLSYRLWQRQFGGVSDAIGQSLRVNGESVVIVGVLPAHFPLPLRDVDVVVPLVPDRDPYRNLRSSTNFLRLFGRLNQGTSAVEAQSELTGICRSLRQQFPVEYARKDAVRAVSFHTVIVGDSRHAMLWLLAASLLVFGTAVANLVSHTLVRATERCSELSIRIALGASRLRLLRQFTVEGILMAVAGSSLGWVLGVWTTNALLPFAPTAILRLDEVSVDRSVLLFTLALMIITSALLTIPPLGVLVRMKSGALRFASRGSVSDRWNQRARRVLVVGEISTALVLLLATSALIETVLRLERVHPGFNPDAVFQARVSVPPTYQTPDDLARFYDRLSERLVNAPGVHDVGLISVAPMSGLLAAVPFTVAGQPPRSERDVPSANLRAITPGYLPAIGTRLIGGRGFLETDTSTSPAVALVSSALADLLLTDPLGQQLLIDDNSKGPRPVTIVGVVENVRQTALDAPPALDIYIPLRQIHPEGVAPLRNNQFWMIKTETAPEDFRVPFLTHLQAVDPDAAVASTGTMRQYLDAWLGPRRFTLALFIAFSLTTVLLAVSGLYALISYTVSQRQREIGVRIALGASERDVHRFVLGEAARLGLAGAVLGLAVAGIVGAWITSALGDTSIDLALIGCTTGMLIAVVLLAACIPARRASRIPPTVALRGE